MSPKMRDALTDATRACLLDPRQHHATTIAALYRRDLITVVPSRGHGYALYRATEKGRAALLAHKHVTSAQRRQAFLDRAERFQSDRDQGDTLQMIASREGISVPAVAQVLGRLRRSKSV